MNYIDEKFKEVTPEETIAKIQGILKGIDIEVTEKSNDSGVSHCYSLNLFANGGVPFSNGKGVTENLARASAYGEFIERLQGGLFFYRYPSFIRDKEMDIHTFAPDVKYMTVEELIENGEWMDYLIEVLGNPRVTRRTIAEQCKIYACADDGKILTLPFYSLFEKKYVYMPMGFVDQMYATNGCCVGNSKEEAWVHALSEILERHAMLSIFTSGEAAPKIPDDVLDKYPIVSEILAEIRQTGEFDVEMFDFSLGNGYPVVSTRLINKKSHGYLVNVASDPVFEIALHRCLTELLQGRNINNMVFANGGRILNKVNKNDSVNNIINQLETGTGSFTADYFANEITCTRQPYVYDDNSQMSNKELLKYALDVFRKIGKPVYVRNFSFLGFPCYRFIVPGFSEALLPRLNEIVPQYAMADDAAKTARNITLADDQDLNMYLFYNNTIKGIYSRYNSFNYISGRPLSGKVNYILANITRAYAAYRLNNYADVVKFLNPIIRSDVDVMDREYLFCVNKYLEFKSLGIDDEKIRIILRKFFMDEYTDKLYDCLDRGMTPFDDYLLKCDTTNCENCKYRDVCSYQEIKVMNNKAGKVYADFVNGQAENEFEV